MTGRIRDVRIITGIVVVAGWLAIASVILAGNAPAVPEDPAAITCPEVGGTVTAPLASSEKKPKDPKEALAGYWKLDEKKDSTARDSSGNGNDGLLYGDCLWQPKAGAVHGALLLDGIDDYVELPIGPLISQLTNCTIMTWVNWSGAGEWWRIFDFGTSDAVNMFLTPKTGSGDSNPTDVRCLRFAITLGGGSNEEQVTAPCELPTGWHHVAVAIDDDHITTLYLDGTPVAENTVMTLTPSDLGVTSNNWLGRSQYEGDSLYAGSLDDFRIYDQALSEGEIQAVMAEAH